MTDEVTLGEIARRLDDIDHRHGAQLADIQTQVRLTNGRTTRLEARVDGHDRELKDLSPAGDKTPAELRELIEMARDARGAVRFGKVLWAIGGALVPIFMWWWSTGRGTP